MFKYSKIGLDSVTLTSNTWELVDSNIYQLSFIQALGAEALVRGVGYAVPYENGGIREGGRAPPPIIEKIVTNFFSSDFGENFSRLFQNSKYFLNFLNSLKKKCNHVFFHDFKYLINLSSILKKRFCLKVSKNICISRPLIFFGKV